MCARAMRHPSRAGHRVARVTEAARRSIHHKRTALYLSRPNGVGVHVV